MATTQQRSIDVLFVIAPHSLLLDIAGPSEAFRLGNLRRAELGLPARFRLRFAGPVPMTATSVGLSLAKLEPLPERLSAATWVVLVGQPNAHSGHVTPATLGTQQWLSRTLHKHLSAASAPRTTICWRRCMRSRRRHR